MEKLYTCTVTCKNCKVVNTITKIPQGIKVVDFLVGNHQKCKNCQCEFFEVKEED